MVQATSPSRDPPDGKKSALDEYMGSGLGPSPNGDALRGETRSVLRLGDTGGGDDRHDVVLLRWLLRCSPSVGRVRTVLLRDHLHGVSIEAAAVIDAAGPTQTMTSLPRPTTAACAPVRL
jgi:hypothetical protein